MITASDRDYKATKRIKQGSTKLKPPFDELATWVGENWDVSVLNVRYDRRNSVHAPRLQVIVEYEAHKKKFHTGMNFDRTKQTSIADKFLEIIGRDSGHGFDVDGLFVVFSAFAPVAKQEADSQISEEELKSLKKRIDNPDLWEISRCFGHVTFFFYTDDQAKSAEKNGLHEDYADRYFALLKPHDEFGYLRRSDFKSSVDSKQNFDENYQSNWFYYYH